MLFGKDDPRHGRGLRHRRAHRGTRRRRLGADVIGVDLRQAWLTAPAAFIEADLSSPASVEALVARLPPRIDALANVAGRLRQ